MTNHTIEITEDELEGLRAAQNYSGGLTPGQNYDVTDRNGETTFAHSPDGIGVYWYDTEDERREDVG